MTEQESALTMQDVDKRFGKKKVLDACTINDHFWVFYGALSNVEYRITVDDTATGATRIYSNPLHQFASRGDTEAFSDP